MRTAAILASVLLAASPGAALGIDLIVFEENGAQGGAARGLYTFDSGTGLSTLRAGVSGSQRFFGLEAHPGTGVVYAADVPFGNMLYTMDVNTGDVTLVGPLAPDTIADIAFHPGTGTLYGMGRNSPYRLYTIDPATGACTFVVNTSDAARCGLVISPAGAAYAFSIDGILSTLDLATGTATLVGGVDVGGVVEDSVFASDGNIYFTTFDGRLFRVDPATGASTMVGDSGMGSGLLGIIEAPTTGSACYANCDNSTTTPVLNVADFTCFLQRFAAADPSANCDESTTPPTLNVADFTCFLQQFAAGCP